MQPLAERMRPKTIDEYIGQRHLLGPTSVLRQAIEAQRIPSMILWGPPGVGKTTLATLISQSLKVPFFSLSAINSGVKDIRETIDAASKQRFFSSASPILFIDEIHRFSKSQQDSLLGAVERGIVTLIGATTENPSFEVIPALLSRCQVYVLKSIEKEDLIEMINRALQQDEFLKDRNIQVEEYEAILQLSGGDGRKLYNVLELITNFQRAGEPLLITNELVFDKVQQNIALYDKGGEAHYDIASAFIKSIRGSDPNAAIYYLARMLDGGEDIEFIARRILISAAEDIGLANPNALLLAESCFQAVKVLGLPEARIPLAEATIYLATSPKSNSAYSAINQALELVQKTGAQPIPLHLRNAPTKLMKELDYGKDYRYAHQYKGNFVEQEFLPESLKGTKLFDPQGNAAEEKIRERLKALWKEKYGY
ncbi:replication-associated recombination protein A [Siphonobacter sp. SORGH_AS_0500]|uniref:replication-associated recombination protein A n=1 Tax=Siphonobacter sp. SORGH_AS_0500 TaxID=1864824 RepID=UPI0028653F58|nr:replication-associated recombination protein A [Siphonobacter sp. SORGH_AS_0500]MDR6193786.1 putative ATPase [Siphonobacter sp. SORGH_AS_0500]